MKRQRAVACWAFFRWGKWWGPSEENGGKTYESASSLHRHMCLILLTYYDVVAESH